jgi:hypothetical protein
LINFPHKFVGSFDSEHWKLLTKLQEKVTQRRGVLFSCFWTDSLVCWNYTQNRKKVTRNWGEICGSPSTDQKEAQIAQRNSHKLWLRKKYITLELLYLRMDILIYWATTPSPPPFLPGSPSIHPLGSQISRW